THTYSGCACALAVREIPQQPVDAVSDDRINHPEVSAEQEYGNDHHHRGRLHLFAAGGGDLLHLRAHVVVERLDAQRPRFHPLAEAAFLRHRRCCRLCHSPTASLLSTEYPPGAGFKNLAGAEGFEPPSPVLETGSLTVELTPLFLSSISSCERSFAPALYLTSRWSVCLRQRGQNLLNSSRSGVVFRFLVVE